MTSLGDVTVGSRIEIVHHERAADWQVHEHYALGDRGTVLQLDAADNTLHVKWDKDLPAGSTWWIPVEAVALADPPPPDLTDHEALERWLDD